MIDWLYTHNDKVLLPINFTNISTIKMLSKHFFNFLYKWYLRVLNHLFFPPKQLIIANSSKTKNGLLDKLFTVTLSNYL